MWTGMVPIYSTLWSYVLIIARSLRPIYIQCTIFIRINQNEKAVVYAKSKLNGSILAKQPSVIPLY